MVLQLQRDPALRARIGAAARRTIEEFFGPEVLREMKDFYFR
jgi:hypothetical protein